MTPGMMPPGMMGMMGMPHMPNMPGGPLPNNKKQRELYIGNLPTGMVTEEMLKVLFSQMIEACEGYDPSPGPPVLNAQLRGGTNGQATFAFVEFRDEKISATVSTFNGMELSGRHLKISHPNGYIEPPVPVETLGVPKELAHKFGLDSYGAMRRRDTPQSEFNDRKARELYVGNLTMGCVTSQMLIDLFTAPLSNLQGLEGDGPPVAEAKVDHSGKFAFVLFRNNQLATIALSLFNKMEYYGRPLLCDRPQGYSADMSQEIPQSLLASLPPMGGGAPPPPPAAVAALVTAATSNAAPSSGGLPQPTRSLCLENLFTDSVLSDPQEFQECVDDIKVECTNFGAVISCVVPTHSNLQGYGAADVGKCFVRYELVSSAVKARAELNGRSFDGNTVRATFLPD
jgi:hypothetical protein